MARAQTGRHPGEMETLRVATLNLWNKSGPWTERKAMICEELLRLDPDVLGLQELLRLVSTEGPLVGTRPGASLLEVPWPWTSESDQLSELAQAWQGAGGEPRHLVFCRAKEYGGGLLLGNGLISRFPVLEAEGFELPGEESGETRSLLYALLDTPAGRLPVFVTHLNWKWHHGSVRVRQVLAIAGHIERLSPLREEPLPELLPPVLMGDFNAVPDSDEIRFLRGLGTLEGKSVYFADSWDYLGGEDAGYTFARSNGFALRSAEPSRRIDYVFVRGPDAWLRGEPREARLAFVEPRPSSGDSAPQSSEELVWASDHYGVAVDLAVGRRNR